MKTIFIAGTDTGVGKTLVAGLFARYLSDGGHSVVTQKWVQTGFDGRSDVDIHLKYMRRSWNDFKADRPFMTPYLFRLASSPHLASKRARTVIDIARIEASLKRLSANFDFVIVEGSGGILVPLSEKALLADVVKKFNLPVLLVAANRIGAINHSLLTIEALRKREIEMLGVIFNDIGRGQTEAVLDDNPPTVERFAKIRNLGRLPRAGSLNKLLEAFAPIGERLRQWIDG